MADEYDYDADDYMGYDDDWLYVEDEYLLPDELAESQLPDPGYSGTNYEIEMETHDYDVYMFWDDEEYGHDEYWDYGGLVVRTDASKPGQKRKRAVTRSLPSTKRRRVGGTSSLVAGDNMDGYDNVRYMSRQDREIRTRNEVPSLDKRPKFAFMADWRTRFANRTGTMSTTMPSEMERAAVDQDEPDESGGDAEVEGEDPGGDDDASEGGRDLLLPNALDPDMLKTMLRERLGEAGLSGIEDSAFVEVIQKMLEGDGGADDAMGQLANTLLGKASSSQEQAITGWLSQQGISLENENEDDATSIGTADNAEGTPETLPRRSQLSQNPPQDSAVRVGDLAEGCRAKTTETAPADGPSSLHPTHDQTKFGGSDISSLGKTEQKPPENPKAPPNETGNAEESVIPPAAKRTRAAKDRARKS